MSIDLYTVYLLIALLSFSLGGAVWYTAANEAEEGLRFFTKAILLHGLAYALLLGVPRYGELLRICSFFCVVSFYVLTMCAIACIHQRKLSLIVLWSPLVLVAIFTALFRWNDPLRIACNCSVLMAIDFVVLWILFQGHRSMQGRGKYLIEVSVVINLAALAMRVDANWRQLFMTRQVSFSLFAQMLLLLLAIIGLTFLSTGFILMTKERTELINKELILRDRLTGLWNRRKIEEAGTDELRRLVRYGTPSALLMIDVDNFKAINDGYGHAAGDTVLCSVAHACQNGVRDTDLVARWGGEEFVLLFASTGMEEALQGAERLRDAVSRIKTPWGKPLSVSIGIAMGMSSDTWHSWLVRADKAMYQAKSSGKNRSMFDVPMQGIEGSLGLAWNDIYLTGHPLVDEDHASILADVNALMALSQRGYDKHYAAGRLQEIQSKMIEHFAREEMEMGDDDAAGVRTHKEQHSALLARLATLIAQFKQDALTLQSVVQFLAYEMCAQHTIRFDAVLFAELMRQ